RCRAAAVCGSLHHGPRHFRMDDDAQTGMLAPHSLDLTNRKSRVNRAMPLPEDHPGALDLIGLQPAEDLGRVPHHHLVEWDAHLVRGVATEMLIREKEHFLAARERPFERRPGVRRRA